ncbi:hypothetical protein GCM10023323_32040 [Streptomyces thinghirensis]|uniref:Uncharacterized protein n=1 Tax=Streptomyces thinghirensis TaxID=551547 RepID=A0ABP9T6E8_9ACTN
MSVEARAFGAVARAPTLPASTTPAPVSAERLAKSLRVSDMVTPVTVDVPDVPWRVADLGPATRFRPRLNGG